MQKVQQTGQRAADWTRSQEGSRLDSRLRLDRSQQTVMTGGRLQQSSRVAIVEIKTIINDYRINTPGGLNTGIMLWELSVIPMILNNSETWNDIDGDTLKSLEDLQKISNATQYVALRYDNPFDFLSLSSGSVKMSLLRGQCKHPPFLLENFSQKKAIGGEIAV